MTTRATGADGALAETLATVLDDGGELNAGESGSIGSGARSLEVLNFSAVIERPLERLPYNPRRPINLPAAVARFVWMMAGSDRLADIAFYEDKVRAFSDDGVSVPGSSYGQRILRPRPGLNQVRGILARLRQDPSSRRAAASIFQPEDAVRESRDIPCAFGLFYHIREGVLHATTLMRSNNAYVLMPYNVFEFSLLAEVVAAELDVELGSLTHTAISMHIYDRDIERARAAVEGYRGDGFTPGPATPSMARNPGPLSQVGELVILEAELRHDYEGLTAHGVENRIDKARRKLNPYWTQFYLLLLLHVARERSAYLRENAAEARAVLEVLAKEIKDPWRGYLPDGTFEASELGAQSVDSLADLELVAPNVGAKIIPLNKTILHRFPTRPRRRIRKCREGDARMAGVRRARRPLWRASGQRRPGSHSRRVRGSRSGDGPGRCVRARSLRPRCAVPSPRHPARPTSGVARGRRPLSMPPTAPASRRGDAPRVAQAASFGAPGPSLVDSGVST